MFRQETQGGRLRLVSSPPLTPYQRRCLWTPRRDFVPLDTHFAIELVTLSGFFRVLLPEGFPIALWTPSAPSCIVGCYRCMNDLCTFASKQHKKHEPPKVAVPKGEGAIGKPPPRALRRETPAA